MYRYCTVERRKDRSDCYWYLFLINIPHQEEIGKWWLWGEGGALGLKKFILTEDEKALKWPTVQFLVMLAVPC
jgi:hypothetical protein